MSDLQLPRLDPALLRAFVDVADTLADDYTPTGLLQRLSEHCVALFGATAAGLLLAGNGDEPEIVASSGDTAALRAALRAGDSAEHRFVQAIPLGLRQESLGTLLLLTPRPLSESRLNAARALADIAAIGLLQDRAIRRSTTLTGQLQHALGSRVVIEQAKGILAQAGGISVETAFDRLRAYSRRNGLRMDTLSSAVVDGTLLPAQLLQDSSR